MNEPISSSSAALVAHWTQLRARASTLSVASGALGFVSAPPAVLISTPEVLAGFSFAAAKERNDEGVLISAVTPAWLSFLNLLASDSNAFMRLDPRQLEELVAAAYEKDGWTVTLTPRSGDKGRDVIAERTDVGAIRLLDQVKRYAPGHVVEAEEVRSLYGVLTLDLAASKGVITTTSKFAPGVIEEFRAVTPTRIELRDGAHLRSWLEQIQQKQS